WYFKLKENSDLLYINSDGATLIHAAATGSSKKISDDVLTIEGLDIDKKDSEQLTALDYAAANEEHPDVFTDYIAKGADPSKAWNLIYWWSAFPSAMIPPDIIEQRKSDVWKKDDAGYIPLMNFAFYYFDLEVESGVVANRMNRVLDFMIASFE